MRLLGFAPLRHMPKLHKQTLSQWVAKHKAQHTEPKGTVLLFKDEFTNYQDADLGILTIRLLEALEYRVVIPQTKDSGRTFFSKGLLRRGKRLAEYNVTHLSPLVNEDTPLVGIEPSTILSFRDEYPDIVKEELKSKAETLAKHTLTIEEFLVREHQAGRISSSSFTQEQKLIKLHGHCQQKSICGTKAGLQALSIPQNYEVEEIPSGCCGMAGSFGFEKEHYKLSMDIGELVLFPAVRATKDTTLIAAAGTSCRHQIKDGTQRDALHPVQILWEALI